MGVTFTNFLNNYSLKVKFLNLMTSILFSRKIRKVF